jgi:hypothetical protein
MGIEPTSEAWDTTGWPRVAPKCPQKVHILGMTNLPGLGLGGLSATLTGVRFLGLADTHRPRPLNNSLITRLDAMMGSTMTAIPQC